MQSERGNTALSEMVKFVLRTYLPTPAVQCL